MKTLLDDDDVMTSVVGTGNNSSSKLANWLSWIGIQSYNLHLGLYGELLGTDFMFEIILLVCVAIQLILYVSLKTGLAKEKSTVRASSTRRSSSTVVVVGGSGRL